MSSPPRPRARRALAPALALAFALVPALGRPLYAAPPGPAASAAVAAGAAAARASAAALGSALARPALPAGHGSAAPPAMSARAPGSAGPGAAPPPRGGDPHAGMGMGEGAPGADRQGPRVFQSGVKPDPTLPPRVVAVDVFDGTSERPMPGVEITLTITERSIAKGDAKNTRRERTEASGSAAFKQLDFPVATEYRVTVQREGATFASPPFQLLQNQSMRATIYIYPVARSMREAAIIVRGFTYVEILDDALQIEQVYRILNVGQSAWLADGTKLNLPAGFKAFKEQPGDLVWAPSGEAVSLRGTIVPGQHETAFRFQIPWKGERELSFESNILPQMQSYRIAADAPAGLQLSAEGFDEAEITQSGTGQRLLVIDRVLHKPEPNFRSIKVRLANLPVRPAGRWYAVALSVLALAGGFYAAGRLRATRPRGGGPTPDERQELEEAKVRLLDEIAALERAHRAGDVGPKTYERLRRNLGDALARLLTRLEGDDVDEHVGPSKAQTKRESGLKRPEVEPVELSPSLGVTPGANPGVQPWGFAGPPFAWG